MSEGPKTDSRIQQLKGQWYARLRMDVTLVLPDGRQITHAMQGPYTTEGQAQGACQRHDLARLMGWRGIT